MKIRFINHAAVLFEHNGVRLLTDPWLYGPAFNDGWDLIAETGFAPREWENIQYIWFSHEHPDHFSPRVLNDIPDKLRSNITVLYQHTADKKVLDFCQSRGFAVRELPVGEGVHLNGGITVTCSPVPLYDSWLLLEAEGARILNLNDVPLRTTSDLRPLAKRIGQPLDVLLTQFSYAGWRGGPEDLELRRLDARKKLAVVQKQIRLLQPKVCIPFASFCYFSHEENAFMNDGINTPEDAVRAIEKTSAQPVLLYPDNTWEVGETPDNDAAIERYRAAYQSAMHRKKRKSSSVTLSQLADSSLKLIERVESRNSKWMLRLLRANPLLPALKPIDVYLWDLKEAVRFSFDSGLQSIEQCSDRYNVKMASDSLKFIFDHPWGIDTLTVNGRFRADSAGLRRLLMTFGVDAINNAGISISPMFFKRVETVSFLLRTLFAKLHALRSAAARDRTPRDRTPRDRTPAPKTKVMNSKPASVH